MEIIRLYREGQQCSSRNPVTNKTKREGVSPQGGASCERVGATSGWQGRHTARTDPRLTWARPTSWRDPSAALGDTRTRLAHLAAHGKVPSGPGDYRELTKHLPAPSEFLRADGKPQFYAGQQRLGRKVQEM